MNALDTLVEPKGHWKFEVFEGDIEREPLTLDQEMENLLWEQEALRTGDLPKGRHLGKIKNRKVVEFEGDNLVTTNGKGLLLDRLFSIGGPPGQITHMGVGNSATAAAVSDTQLLGATPAPAVLAFDSTPTRSGLVVTCVRTFATGEGNMNWQELGLFNGATNGTSVLFNRIAPIGPFNKTSAVSIVVTVTITQT